MAEDDRDKLIASLRFEVEQLQALLKDEEARHEAAMAALRTEKYEHGFTIRQRDHWQRVAAERPAVDAGREALANAILLGLMRRFQEPGYSDENAIAESRRLAGEYLDRVGKSSEGNGDG